MNSTRVKDKIRNIVKEKKVDFNTVFRLYMYDRFIERLAQSKYIDAFILKGGFYLSSLFGIENRATMDIDAALTKVLFNKENIRKIIEEIIAINIDDGAILTIVSISNIRAEDEYGGYRITINIKIENIKETFHVDVATGDPITPKEIKYKYLPILGDKHVNLWAYNIETALAEKLETIFSRVEANGRLKDYYDIYLIHKINSQSINKNHLQKAIKATFQNRSFNANIKEVFDKIKDSKILMQRWNSYSEKNNYAKGISYESIMECLEEIIEIIPPTL